VKTELTGRKSWSKNCVDFGVLAAALKVKLKNLVHVRQMPLVDVTTNGTLFCNCLDFFKVIVCTVGEKRNYRKNVNLLWNDYIFYNEVKQMTCVPFFELTVFTFSKYSNSLCVRYTTCYNTQRNAVGRPAVDAKHVWKPLVFSYLCPFFINTKPHF